MILPLVFELRKRGVPIGIQEVVSLADALKQGLHQDSLDEFYFVARSILIHDEAYLDDFDQVFGGFFRDLPYVTKSMLDDILKWLEDPLARPELSEEDKSALETIDLEELRRLFEERIREQTERHDGGGYWIGTGGRSPFGTQGYHPSGISLQARQSGASSGKSAMGMADARSFRAYRKDLTLDVRQFEVALKRLRHFNNEGVPDELDLEQTIDATARNFGELELVFKKPRRPDTRVILMMDVGGSMEPYSALISQLFSAAKRATHWKELRTYYFHNCVYGEVFSTEGLRDKVLLRDLLRECDSRFKLIMVGDASMAHSELLGSAMMSSSKLTSGLDWLTMLRSHFTHSIWLNPWRAHGSDRGSTVELIADVFPMFPLTLAGLDEGLKQLNSQKS